MIIQEETNYLTIALKKNALKKKLSVDNPLVKNTISVTEPCDVYHSSEDIQKIHVQSLASRVHAFHDLTQAENVNLILNGSGSINLKHEFQQIMDSDHLSVFIEEFELLISNLNDQWPRFHKALNNIEGLIHFKLSIHLIKHLSKMMQAVHLLNFSQIVIDYLEDIVDGRIHVTSDVIDRLSLVVEYFHYYIESISLSLIRVKK